jgi:hypothetical protein
VTLSIVKPTVDFITGAGGVQIASAAGVHAPPVGGSAKFELNLQYDKTGVTKGKFVFSFTRTENGVVRQYELAAAGGASLAIRRTSTGGVAFIAGTATLRDVTIKTAPVVVFAEAPLVVTATDAGEPSSADAMSLIAFSRTGGVLLATGWNGIRAVEQPLQTGNVQIHQMK